VKTHSKGRNRETTEYTIQGLFRKLLGELGSTHTHGSKKNSPFFEKIPIKSHIHMIKYYVGVDFKFGVKICILGSCVCYYLHVALRV
jgi:hypothetical protein